MLFFDAPSDCHSAFAILQSLRRGLRRRLLLLRPDGRQHHGPALTEGGTRWRSLVLPQRSVKKEVLSHTLLIPQCGSSSALLLAASFATEVAGALYKRSQASQWLLIQQHGPSLFIVSGGGGKVRCRIPLTSFQGRDKLQEGPPPPPASVTFSNRSVLVSAFRWFCVCFALKSSGLVWFIDL